MDGRSSEQDPLLLCRKRGLNSLSSTKVVPLPRTNEQVHEIVYTVRTCRNRLPAVVSLVLL